MKFFVLILSTVISFYGYGTEALHATAGSSASVWPTMEQLKDEKATLVHKVDGLGEFTIDCSDESVRLLGTFASPVGKDGLTVRLVSYDPSDKDQQIVLAALVATLRVGESSKGYGPGPVKRLVDTFKGVKTNLGLQNDTAGSGLPRFWVEVYQESEKSWMPVGFMRSGNGSKDRLKDVGVTVAMAENEDLKAIIESGHVIPGVGGFSEPAALLHREYHGKGIGEAVMHLMLQVVLPVYREMGVLFGVMTKDAKKEDYAPLNWIFSTASKDNEASQGLIRKAPGVINLGEFTSVHGGVKKQYLLVPVVSDSLACTREKQEEDNGKVTYVVHKKEEPVSAE